MRNDEIEEAAVNHIQDIVRNNENIQVDISKNDKTPLIDGELRFYEPNKYEKVANFSWAVNVQCKGHELKKSKHFKPSPKFQLKKKYLRGFQNYGGVLLLVVHIRGKKKKAYYKILGPLDIRHELLEMGERKYRSISLKPFPDDFDSQIRIAKLAHHKCQINKLRLTDDQFSLATGAQLLAADPIDLNKPGKFGIGSDIPSHIELTLRDGNTIPLDGAFLFWPEHYFPHETNLKIKAGHVIISDAHRRLINDHVMELAITPSLILRLDTQNMSGSVTITISGSLEQALVSLEFLNFWLENDSFMIGDEQVEWRLDKTAFAPLKKNLSIFRDIEKLCKLLGVDISLLEVDDIARAGGSLEKLVNFFLYDGELPLPTSAPQKLIVQLGPWLLNFIAYPCADAGQSSSWKVANTATAEFLATLDVNSDVKNRITGYDLLSVDDLSKILNLDLGRIVECYEDNVEESYQASYANDTVLKLIEAADLQPLRGPELLEGARRLSLWLYGKPNFSELAQLNIWQIDKRLGKIGQQELTRIRKFREGVSADSEEAAALKAGASILLYQPDEVDFWLTQMDAETRQAFEKTPIYKLLTEPQSRSSSVSPQGLKKDKWDAYKASFVEEALS